MLFVDSIPEAVYELLFPRELEKKIKKSWSEK